MKNPYDILGLPKNSAEEVLRAKYGELRARYSEQRFKAGNEGNEGARLLNELDGAWREIERDLEMRKSVKDGDIYSAIDAKIKEGNYDGAQEILDTAPARDAQWHYYQAMVYYKREWLNESRAQLAIAVNMEPNNARYSDALNKIDMVMGNKNVYAGTMGGSNQGPYSENIDPNQQAYYQQQQRNSSGDFCTTCCAAYCCSELCCSSMRCCV